MFLLFCFPFAVYLQSATLIPILKLTVFSNSFSVCYMYTYMHTVVVSAAPFPNISYTLFFCLLCCSFDNAFAYRPGYLLIIFVSMHGLNRSNVKLFFLQNSCLWLVLLFSINCSNILLWIFFPLFLDLHGNT